MDHLLRTLAAVPPSDRVLDWHADLARLRALVGLGFDTYAAHGEVHTTEELRAALATTWATAPQRIITARPAALGYPDGYFDWVIGWRVLDDATGEGDAADRLREALRVMKDGAWIYLTARAIPDDFDPTSEEAGYAGDSPMTLRYTPESLTALASSVGLVIAEKPAADTDKQGPLVRGIFRKVTDATPL